MRFLGIDFGERRIGLAISDPEGRLAVPLGALERASDRAAVAAIAALARREGVGGLVVGEPRGLEGGRGPAAARARRFAERLAAATGLPWEAVDEALTSVEAGARLRDAGVDPRRHPERIDAVAAQILLQEALDRRRDAAARGDAAAQAGARAGDVAAEAGGGPASGEAGGGPAGDGRGGAPGGDSDPGGAAP